MSSLKLLKNLIMNFKSCCFHVSRSLQYGNAGHVMFICYQMSSIRYHQVFV